MLSETRFVPALGRLLLAVIFVMSGIGKIARCLGWKPLVPFEEGVANMLRDLGAWASAPVWTPESIAAATGNWFTYLSKRA